MESHNAPSPWLWDDNRKDYYYYNYQTKQWIYSNGPTLPVPLPSGYSEPASRTGTAKTTGYPEAQPNPSTCNAQSRFDPTYRPGASQVHPTGLVSQPYAVRQQLPTGYLPVNSHSHPTYTDQGSNYVLTTGGSYPNPCTGNDRVPRTAYLITQGGNPENPWDDQDDRNRQGRDHWHDNNPPSNGGKSTGGDETDDDDETQGHGEGGIAQTASGYDPRSYQNGVSQATSSEIRRW